MSLFLSTLSLRRATRLLCYTILARLYFYPRSPCGERRRRSVKLFRQNYISIHALLAESDRLGLLGWLRVLISIHALLAESDCVSWTAPSLLLRFLSTLSLRRATGGALHYLIPSNDFYPRSPCGERQPTAGILRFNPFISIHALLAESDLFACPFL